MASKKVEFHEEASLEYEVAFEWYFVRSEQAASRFAEAPQRWPGGIAGTRKLLLRRFPFAIFYRELPSLIQVLAVAHGHRRPGYWKERT